MARRIGSATALEVRASGAHWVFEPCVAVSLLFLHTVFHRNRTQENRTIIYGHVYGVWYRCAKIRDGEDVSRVTAKTPTLYAI